MHILSLYASIQHQTASSDILLYLQNAAIWLSQTLTISLSGLSLPGLHFPRHAAKDHMFCETFIKTKDASVVEIVMSHVSCKYIAPTCTL